MSSIDGFIISQRGWNSKTQLEMGAGTFDRTIGGAWRRHIRMDGRNEIDFPIFVQRWSDKGYGPIAVRMETRATLSQPEGTGQ